MIGILARTRTNAVALAVLAALVGALFVALQPAGAAPSPQSVAPIPPNACVANPGIVLGYGDSCDIDVRHFDASATNMALADGSATDVILTPTSTSSNTIWTITGSAATTGTVNVDVRGSGDDNIAGNADDNVIETLSVTVVGFGITKVEVVDDTDALVAAQGTIMVRATLRSQNSAAEVRLTVPTTGLSIETSAGTSQSQWSGVSTNDHYDFTVNTAGAPAREYTLTFTADDNGAEDNTAEQAKNVSQQLTVTVGDPGVALSNATLTLGNSVNDVPYTADNEAAAQSDTVAADSEPGVKLVVTALDAKGDRTNASLVDQIIVIAPGGTVAYVANTLPAAVAGDGANSRTIGESSTDNPDVDNVGSRTVITVTKTDKTKAGTVTVYAIVSGKGGAARTDDLTINFSGKNASVSVADAIDTLRAANADATKPDTIKLAVTGADAGGIAGDPGSGFSITITDPDGKGVNSNKIEATLATTYAAGKRDLSVTGKGDAGCSA